MKKMIFTFALAIFGFTLHAQVYVNGKDLNELTKGSYLEIDDKRINGASDYSVKINYGQEVWGKKNEDFISDKEGGIMRFKNIVEILNYFEENGWTYTGTIGDTLDEKHLLKRK